MAQVKQQRGLFVVFEGLDRCGKTSQCDNLVKNLQNEGKQVYFARYPNRQTVIGQIINQYLSGDKNLNDETIHLLFSANRWEQQKEIESKLNSGINIICDRYSYSGAVYTSAKGLDIEWCKNPDKGLIKPDIVFYLHAPKEVIRERAGFGNERYENECFQQKVRDCFEVMLEKEDNIISIDASKTVEEISQEIQNHTNKAFEDLQNLEDQELKKLWI